MNPTTAKKGTYNKDWWPNCQPRC